MESISPKNSKETRDTVRDRDDLTMRCGTCGFFRTKSLEIAMKADKSKPQELNDLNASRMLSALVNKWIGKFTAEHDATGCRGELTNWTLKNP